MPPPPPTTYERHDGQRRPCPPPPGWWQAKDHRWYPPEAHWWPREAVPLASKRGPRTWGTDAVLEFPARSWWEHPIVAVPMVIVALLMLFSYVVTSSDLGEIKLAPPGTPATLAPAAPGP